MGSIFRTQLMKWMITVLVAPRGNKGFRRFGVKVFPLLQAVYTKLGTTRIIYSCVDLLADFRAAGAPSSLITSHNTWLALISILKSNSSIMPASNRKIFESVSVNNGKGSELINNQLLLRCVKGTKRQL